MKISHSLILFFLITNSCSVQSPDALSFEGIRDFEIETALEQSKETNKPLLIYFTAFGCLNCRRIENEILSNADIAKTIREEYIFIPLFVDDRREAKEAQWKKSIRSKKMLKLIGHLNSELQIVLTQTGSQPYFFVLNHKKEVISESVFVKTVSEFQSFLSEGIGRQE